MKASGVRDILMTLRFARARLWRASLKGRGVIAVPASGAAAEAERLAVVMGNSLERFE